MRDQFEKLPEIARLIEKRNMIFNEEISRYGALGYADDLSLIDDIGFVSGAWHAFQEQQTKINAVLQYLDTGDHPLDFSANTIRELLK